MRRGPRLLCHAGETVRVRAPFRLTGIARRLAAASLVRTITRHRLRLDAGMRHDGSILAGALIIPATSAATATTTARASATLLIAGLDRWHCSYRIRCRPGLAVGRWLATVAIACKRRIGRWKDLCVSGLASAPSTSTTATTPPSLASLPRLSGIGRLVRPGRRSNFLQHRLGLKHRPHPRHIARPDGRHVTLEINSRQRSAPFDNLARLDSELPGKFMHAHSGSRRFWCGRLSHRVIGDSLPPAIMDASRRLVA